jgi:hypothetical protein
MLITRSVQWAPADLARLTPISGSNPVRPVDSIVIHHTGGGPGETPQGIHEYHLSIGYGGVGYHYLIEPTGIVWRGRPLWARGAHAKSQNSGRIGIALLGTYSTEAPGYQMCLQARRLIMVLEEMYGRLKLYPHYSMPNSSTDCPGAALVQKFQALGMKWEAM